uniref:UDENN FNIP1/2-type domain-containing protein n=1 Tax=Strigamia maritima TaxID=126957 RepID=T1J365_STRMM
MVTSHRTRLETPVHYKHSCCHVIRGQTVFIIWLFSISYFRAVEEILITKKHFSMMPVGFHQISAKNKSVYFYSENAREQIENSCSIRHLSKKVDPPVVQNNGLVQRFRSCPVLKSEKTTDEGIQITRDGIVYQFLRPKTDGKMLGEMVFGSVAMSYRGTTSKIHKIRAPPQLMMTKVFPSPQPKSEHAERKYADSLPNSLADCIYVHESDHLERLSSSAESSDWLARSCHEYGQRSADERRQLRCAGSLNSLLEHRPTEKCPSTPAISASLSHSGSYHSLQRRMHRCRATSMEFGFPRKHDDLNEGVTCSRRTKLAMALVVSLDDQHDPQFQTFFFSHVTLIEGHLNKLRIDAEKACVNKKTFLKCMFDAYEDLRNFLYDLYTAPRLPNPVWLSMMSPHQPHHVICLRFVTEFMNLLNQFDNKSSKFFVSTLLTAILTHHLAWVPTVMPSGINPNHSYHEKHSAKWLHTLAKSNPYNPLWVQLGDLYGAIGNPCKMSRTVVLGKKAELVKRFLYVLSYFIRCSEVYESTDAKMAEEKRHFNSLSDPSLMTNCNTSCDSCAQTVVAGTSLMNDEMTTSTVLRPGRHLCESCRRAGGAVRTGRIFEPTETQNGIDRDSGIGGCESDDQTGTSPSSARVRFTIGDVPLKQIRKHTCSCGNNSNGLKRVSSDVAERDSGFQGERVTVMSDRVHAATIEHETNVASASHRARHKSESSAILNSTFVAPLEVPLPAFEGKQAFNCTAEYYRNFAWSLMANYSDHYMSDFALQGTSDADYGCRLATDLCVSADKPVLDDPVAESVCILANVDNWSVQVISNKSCEMSTGTYASSPVSMSQLIANTTESVQHLWKLKMSPEFCLMHLEDRLQEIYFKSRLLAEYLTEKSTCDIEQMTSDLGLDASDLPLLMAVASTHSAPVTCMYGVSYR